MSSPRGVRPSRRPPRPRCVDIPSAPHVVRVISHLLQPRQVSADGHTAYDIVLLDLPADDSPDALPILRERLHEAPGLTVELAGGPAFYGDVQEVSERDLQRSEVISLPLAALALLLVFGSLVAAGVPLVVGGSSVLVALAAIFVVASFTPMSIFVLNLATLLGLGLGVDYSLLLTSRFREELAKQPADEPTRVQEAVRITVATAGRAVFFSGLTVLLGLLGLVLFEFMILRSVGIAGAIVVGFAVLAALTLLPALLALSGQHLDRLAIRRVQPRPAAEGPWARHARRVMQRPLAFLLPTLALLLLLGSPFLHVRFNSPDASILPADLPSRAAFDRLRDAFGEGEFAPIAIAVRTNGNATDAENVAALFDYSRRIAADPRVTRVDSLVDIDPRLTLSQYQLMYADPNGPRDRFMATALAATTKGDLTAFTITTPFGPNRDEGRALVRDLRAAAGPLAAPAGTTVLVGGGAADVADVVDGVAADFPRTAVFIIVTTYIVLFALLRSVILPAKALILNALSLTASFGALVWIFQDGNLSASLGFQPRRVRRDDAAGDPVLRAVRPVDGLRGLPAVAHEGGLGHDRRQHRGRRPRPRAERADRDLGGADRGGRGRLVRLRRHRADQGARARRGDRGGARRDRRPGAARAVDDAAARSLELVDACLAGAVRGQPPARIRGRGRSGGGPMRRLAALIAAAAVVAGCVASGSPILANPPAPRPSIAPPSAAPSPPADPLPIVLPRDDGPHDRLTEWWYYTGHLVGGTDDGRGRDRRFGFEFVIFRAERGSFPTAWASHLAITDETGAALPSTPSASRSGAASTARRADATARRRASTSTLTGSDPTDPGDARSAAVADGRRRTAPTASGRRSRPDEAAAAGVPAPRPRRCRWRAGSRRRSTTATAGSTSGPRAARTTTRGRRWMPSGLAAARRRDVSRSSGDAWFDHQWGDFISVGGGGWDWFAVNLEDGTDLTLSLVRDADGSYPLVYGTLVDADGHDPPPRRATRSPSTATGRWTSPTTGADLPGGLVDRDPRRATSRSTSSRRSPTRSSTRARRRASCTGRGHRSSARGAGSARSAGEAYVELTGYGPAGVAP